MNAEIRPIRTAGELGLAQAYASARASLPGGADVVALRDATFRRFEANGLPHRRIEEWKYTDLRASLREAKPLASPPGTAAIQRAAAVCRLPGVDVRNIVFVDGTLSPELSDLADLEPGLTIGSLGAALKSADVKVTDRLGKVVPSDDIALALNTAFMNDGAVIRVAARAAIARPVHLVFVNAGDRAASVFPRSQVMVEADASVTIVESHIDAGAAGYQVNAALEIDIADHAQVNHIKITRDARSALHVSTLLAAIGANARFNTLAFTLGGGLVRNQMFIRLTGEGAFARVGGATLLREQQHADATLVVDHVAAGCQSRELFKSVLDGESRGVFQGKIIVRPGAQKTDGKMMTRALLLSAEAEADAKPELEIFADDVQCGHGATAGTLDRDLLFYLRARGIPPHEAEALLIESFIGEALEAVEHPGLREMLADLTRSWLATRA